ncbi:MAG: sulfite exporter TauE/SafE family protein [Bacteroidetes bacterium]|nr:sulfite exporter TauE/SafE family protein [Bacteroidota bacterium]
MNGETILAVILIGLAAGVLGGMVGVGGGIIMVPALVYFLAFSQHRAQGTSLALMLFPVGILGVINYYRKGYVDLRIAGLLAVGFILGSYLGSRFSLSLPQSVVKKIFAAVMLLVALRMLFWEKK